MNYDEKTLDGLMQVIVNADYIAYGIKK